MRDHDEPPEPRAVEVKGEQVSVDPQVQTILDAMGQMGGPPLSDLSPTEARAMYRALSMLEQGEAIHRVDDRLVPTAAGDLAVRVYTPEDAVGSNRGVLLWLHGGGWVIGDLDTADSTCRALANRAGAVVVSVDYRLAPEHPAPAALEDCLAALTWTVENAELLGVDVSKVAVGGDSAGGNLAALVCQRVRDEFGPDIDFQLLVYPVTDLTLGHPSIDENAEGYFLTKASMEWFVDCYLGDRERKDASVSPLFADLSGLPPALVITAEYDPLRDEGEAYATRLQEAGVPTEHRRYDGQIHGFLGMATMLDGGRHALDLAGAALRTALA
jgi:acetyl esterase